MVDITTAPKPEENWASRYSQLLKSAPKLDALYVMKLKFVNAHTMLYQNAFKMNIVYIGSYIVTGGI